LLIKTKIRNQQTHIEELDKRHDKPHNERSAGGECGKPQYNHRGHHARFNKLNKGREQFDNNSKALYNENLS
jgi:hypothetical protein